MRRLLAPVLVAALSVGLLSGAPQAASAAPPTSAWTGASGGDTAGVDLTLTGLSLTNARLAAADADADSGRTPRSKARSANLGAAVAGLGLGVVERVAGAGPAAETSTTTQGVGASAAGVVSVGALTVADTAAWGGDSTCLTSGPLARASTQTAGVGLNPLGLTLLSTGTSTTTGTTELVANGTGSLNHGVRGTATGAVANVNVLGTTIGVAGTSTLQATATGSAAGGVTYGYDPGTVSITPPNGSARTVALGSTDSVTLTLPTGQTASIGVRVNRPTTSASASGTAAQATVSVVTVNVRVYTTLAGVDTDVLTSTIDLLPLRASATVSAGGIDCPPAAPTVTQPAAGSATNDTTPTFAGTGVPGATVKVSVDGTVQTGSVTAAGDGRWTFDAPNALAEGSHTVSATQSVNGTSSAASATVTFRVDTTAPSAPVLDRPVAGSTTADDTPDYQGTAEANATVDVYEGSTRLATGRADGSGSYSLTSDRLQDGPHTVRVVATDAAGNTSPSSTSTTFTVDSTAPAKPVVLQPADGTSTTETRPAISGTAEVGSRVQVKVDGDVVGTVTATDGTFSVTPTSALAQGAHTVTATATDAVGNVSDVSDAVRFTVDTTAPAAPVITVPASGSSVGQVRPPIRGTAEARVTVRVSVDGVLVGQTTAAADGSFSVTPDRDLAVGLRTATATATDAAGNVSADSAAVPFTVDLTAPAAPVLDTPTNGARTSDTTPTYTGSAEAGSTVRVYEGTTLLGTGTATGGSFSIVSSTLADGSHTVRVTATDAAGNVSADSNANTFTVDTAAPAVPVVTVPAAGTVTNDSTPTIAGTAEAGASVTVLVDGSVVGTATADPQGAWSVESTLLADGTRTVRARATDDVGNASGLSAAVSFVVDTRTPAAPVVVNPADGSRTSDTTPAVTGTAEANATVTAYEGTTVLGTAVADAQGAYRITSSPLAEGEHRVFTTATDAGGNVSPASATHAFTIDLTAPAAPVLTTPAAGSQTRDTTPTYTGTAEAGATVRVYEGARLLGTGTADGAGAFSIASASLAEGDHTVVARATDPVGNVSVPSASTTFAVDFIAPDAPVVTVPAEGASVADTTPTVLGTAEAGASVEVLVDGSSVGTATADGQGHWSLDSTTLAEGGHSVRARATDVAGNVSGLSAPIVFTVDVTAPTAPTLSTPADGSRTADRTPTYSGVAAPGSTVRVYEDGTVLGTGQADLLGAYRITSAQLDEGLHAVYATATDNAGNVSVPSSTHDFTVDATAPDAPVVTVPAPGTLTTDPTPTISGRAEAGASVTVLVDGVPVGTGTADGRGAWSLESSPLGQGEHEVTARATDATGNRSAASASVTFTVDSLAPLTPVLTTPANGSTTSDTTPTYTGRAESGSTVTVYEGTTVLAAVRAVDGAFEVDSAVLAEGPHTVAVTATDAAGNVSPRSASHTFTVDTSVPAAPVVATPADGSRTSDATPTYTGTALAGATVRAYEGTTLLGTGTADGAGRFSITSSTLAEGPHTVSVTETNAAGTVSPASNANTFTVDLSRPDAPVVQVPTAGQTTADPTPTVSGTAEAGSTVEVLVDGRSVGTTTVGTDGRWTLDTTLLAEGPHVVRAQATDEAGNVSALSDPVTFTVDATAPAAPLLVAPLDGSTTTDPTPTYRGTAEPRSTVAVYEGTTVLGTGTADALGAFAITSARLADGVHQVVATATDAVGNVFDPSLATSFTVDATAPGAPVVTVPASGDLLTDTTPTISGTAEAGALVEVLVDGRPVGTATANASGAWTLESTPLGQGEHEVRARATDAAGNTSGLSAGVGFTVDSLAPAVPVLTTPANGSSTRDSTPTYAGLAESGATVTVYEGTVVRASVKAVDGRFSVESALLTDGSHTVAVTATDAAGNVSLRSNSSTFTVDTTAPAVPVVLVPTAGAATADTTPTVSGTAEAGSVVEVFVDGRSVGTVRTDGQGAWSLDSTELGDGPHTVTATSTDAVGNVSSPSVGVDFTVDSTTPAAPVLTAPAAGSSTPDTTPTYAGTAESGSTVRVYEDGTLLATVVAVDGRFVVDSTVLGEGEHTVYAVATDTAGNASDRSATVTFIVDTVAPTAPLLTAPADGSTTRDTTPTYEGSAEPGSTVRVLEGTTVLATVVATDGTFSVDSSVLAEGPHTVYVTATDAAGNVSERSATTTFTVDTTVPAQPVLTTPADGSSTNDTTPTYTGTAEAGSTVRVYEGATVLATAEAVDGQFVVDSAELGEGPHTVYLIAYDGAGNASVRSAAHTFTVDTRAPAAPTLTAPADGSSVADATPTYEGAAESGSTVRVYEDGTLLATVGAVDGRFSVDSAVLGEGPHTVYAVATDAAGNDSPRSATTTFTVDTVKPAVPVLDTPADGSSTSDMTPTYEGSAEAGTVVEVYEGTTLLGSGTATAGGTFSIVSSTLDEGQHTVFVTATDAAGNVSVASEAHTFTVDASAPGQPVLTTPADGSSTSDTTPTYRGAAESGTTVKVYEDGTLLAGVVAVDGAFSVDSSVLGDGPHAVYVTATDAAGNLSERSATTTFTVDTATPAAPVLATPADGSSTSDTTPTYTGTAESGSTVRVYEGTTVLATVVAVDGRFSVDSSVLAEGAHTVLVTATDAAGNVAGPSNANTFTVDSRVPAAPVLDTPADGSSTSDTTPTYTGAAESGSTVRVYEGTTVLATVVAVDGRFSVDSSVLAEGPHTVYVTATDATGNISVRSNQHSFTIDTTVPAAPVLLTPENASTTNDTTPPCTGTAPAGTTVRVYEGTTLLATTVAATDGSFSVDSAVLTEGQHTVFATATNAAGTVSVPSGSTTFVVDTTPPAAPVVTVPANRSTTTDSTPDLEGLSEPGTTVEVFVDGRTVGTTTASPAGTWVLPFPSPDQQRQGVRVLAAAAPAAEPLELGRHVLTARATDAAGNVSARSNRNVFRVVAGTAPAPVITSPTPGETVTGTDVQVCGTGTPGATILLSRVVEGEDVPLGRVVVEDDGTWCAQVDLPEGASTVHAVEVGDGGELSDEATVRFEVQAADDGSGSGDGNGNGSGSGSGSGNGSGNGGSSTGGGSLASTGGPSLVAGGLGLLLVLAGAVTLVVHRRRSSSDRS